MTNTLLCLISHPPTIESNIFSQSFRSLVFRLIKRPWMDGFSFTESGRYIDERLVNKDSQWIQV